MREKYIEEVSETIARSICPIYREDCDEYQPHTCTKCFIFSTPIGCLAEYLYNAGYRKQSEGEWISVENPPDEYRDEYGELIPFLACCKGTVYPFRAVYDGKNWGDGIGVLEVTHWMPLPEPPKED